MFKLKTKEQIKIIREGGRILAEVLKILTREVKPGITTNYLENLARKLLKERNAEGSFLNYHPSFLDQPYPAVLCTCVNEEIVHAIPSGRVLQEGDILSLDFGVKYQGLMTDAAVTVPVGQISPQAEKLIKVTRESLELAMKEVVIGNRLGDLGFVIQNWIESNGFQVVDGLCGHGVGIDVHEEPNVLNSGKRGTGMKLVEGMVIAIEPMAAIGSTKIKLGKDGFGYQTLDGSLSAHFEHTIAITKDGPWILTEL
ncbi:type I methionyl aminopeptidase [Candidatus Azambacteria bacterium]|nr:type I methionyl aminopeptidase [Candidatus Azambacteria bacterium]